MAETDPHQRVVVTGLGTVNPAGNNIDEAWRNFQTSKSFVSGVPMSLGNYQSMEVAGVVNGFDINKYGADRQVRRSDLFAHLGMAAGVEAMLNSGRLRIDSIPSFNNRASYQLIETDSQRLGVIAGIAAGGTRAIEKLSEDLMTGKAIGLVDKKELDLASISKLNPARAATEVAKLIHAKAGAYSINSACASSAQAIYEAYKSVKSGELDVVVAMGAESAVHAVTYEGFKRLYVLASYEEFKDDPSKASRPLNQKPTGMVIGQSGGAMVLERLSDALDRNAPILAEIAGGFFFTDPDNELAPTSANEVRLVGTALERSGVDKKMIGLVDLHSAGSKGDEIELLGLEALFGDFAENVAVNAKKSKIGHTMGAAGVTESVILVKEINSGIITPTANIENPYDTALQIPRSAIRRNLKTAVKISLGLDGQYCCLVFKKFEP